MSLYNTVYGVSPVARLCILILQVDHNTIPRFRDAWLNDDGTEIILLTRTGGGNRSEYQEENAALTKINGYLRDHDDSFDVTFALFYYSVPEKFREDTAIVAKVLSLTGKGADSRGPAAMVATLYAGGVEVKEHNLTPDSPEVVEAAEALDRIITELKKEKDNG